MTVHSSAELAALERQPAPLDLLAAGGGIAAAASSSAVVEWAQRLTVVAAAVDLVVETPFVPASFWPLPLVGPNGEALKLKDWPQPWLKHANESAEDYGHRRRIARGTATLAALHGEQYGWTPGQSWRLLYAQNGRVSLYYEGVGALLRGAGYRIEVVERTATVSRIALIAPGGHRSEWEFTMEQAVLAGYVQGKGPNTGNNSWKGNAKYNTDPMTMLYARNLTRAARIEAPHVIAGMPIVELDDDEPVEVGPEPAQAVTVGPAQPTRALADVVAGAERAATAQSEGGAAETAGSSTSSGDGRPPASKPPAAEGGSKSDPPKMKAAQWKSINTRLDQCGVGREEDKLRVLSGLLDREIRKGWGELNAEEAALVLDNLAGDSGRNRAVALAMLLDEDPPANPPADPAPPVEDPPADPWGINDAAGKTEGEQA